MYGVSLVVVFNDSISLSQPVLDSTGPVSPLCFWTMHYLLRHIEATTRYLAILALKWNLTCGGVNQQTPSYKMGIFSSSKTIVVGVDVTHPSPRSREGTPSVAGVVTDHR